MIPRVGPAAWFWLLAPPAAVVIVLVLFHNVFAVFAIYHLGFCLLLPMLVNLLYRRYTLPEHLAALGLTGPGTGRALALGLALAALFAGAVLLGFRWTGGLALEDNRVAATLAAWGVGPDRTALMFWFMALANGPAEELYWRGFVPAELAAEPNRRRALLVTATGYASYHGVTIFLFLSSWLWAGVFLAAVWGAGLFWGWLRERTGSVWPPLLAHAAATAAYMAASRHLLAP